MDYRHERNVATNQGGQFWMPTGGQYSTPIDIGPGLEDPDIARELLPERPGRWYLTGYLVPAPDASLADPSEPNGEDELADPAEATDPVTGGGRAEDDSEPDPAATRRIFQPSSLGLTVQVPLTSKTLQIEITWGDYVTEPPMTELELTERPRGKGGPLWRRLPRSQTVTLPIPEHGRGAAVIVPDSGAQARPGGALQVEAVARAYTIRQPDGSEQSMRVVTVLLVNRRPQLKNRASDLTTIFQACLKVTCAEGLLPRADLSGLDDTDFDRRLADLQVPRCRRICRRIEHIRGLAIRGPGQDSLDRSTALV